MPAIHPHRQLRQKSLTATFASNTKGHPANGVSTRSMRTKQLSEAVEPVSCKRNKQVADSEPSEPLGRKRNKRPDERERDVHNERKRIRAGDEASIQVASQYKDHSRTKAKSEAIIAETQRGPGVIPDDSDDAPASAATDEEDDDDDDFEDYEDDDNPTTLEDMIKNSIPEWYEENDSTTESSQAAFSNGKRRSKTTSRAADKFRAEVPSWADDNEVTQGVDMPPTANPQPATPAAITPEAGPAQPAAVATEAGHMQPVTNGAATDAPEVTLPQLVIPPAPPEANPAPSNSTDPVGGTPATPNALQLRFSPAGNLVITQLSAPLQLMFRQAVQLMEARLVFECAFPDAAGPQAKFIFLRDTLLQAAEDAQQPDVRQELLTNITFLRHFCSALETRMCQFRSHFRNIIASKVPAHYGLVIPPTAPRGRPTESSISRSEQASGDSAAALARLGELFQCSRYMYSTDSRGNYQTNKPYSHPIFIDALAEFLFASRRPFIARHAAAFEVEWQGETKPEIPAPLVALLATAVYAALTDYKNRLALGKKSADFSADSYAEVYGGHRKALEEVEQKRPRAYHQMLEDLFQRAQSGYRETSTQNIAADILEGLDLDGMPEDA